MTLILAAGEAFEELIVLNVFEPGDCRDKLELSEVMDGIVLLLVPCIFYALSRNGKSNQFVIIRSQMS